MVIHVQNIAQWDPSVLFKSIHLPQVESIIPRRSSTLLMLNCGSPAVLLNMLHGPIMAYRPGMAYKNDFTGLGPATFDV